jgi:site-specific DNA recombinase
MTKSINFDTKPMIADGLRAVGYCRLSKKDIRERNFDSINNQKEAITEYAKNNHIQLLKFYEEVRSVGRKRYEFDAMIKDAKKKEFNLILVKDWERFDRIYERLRYAEQDLKKLNIKIIAINYPDLEGVPKKFLQFSGDIYREIVSEKIIHEKDKKWRLGKNMNKPPFGYRKRKNGGFVIIEKDAQIIRDLFKSYLDGMTIKKLAVMYEMSFKVVMQRLRCRTYIGDLGYKGDWKIGTHQPIISKEVFEEVQKRING